MYARNSDDSANLVQLLFPRLWCTNLPAKGGQKMEFWKRIFFSLYARSQMYSTHTALNYEILQQQEH